MKLADWLYHERMSQRVFAKKVGLSQAFISQLCQYQTWPGRDVAQRIMDATEGRVTPNDFLENAE